ncbi:flippase-like domain-containing protein [bacterium]|nr:flippase-like domain-containing protein [bacterium]
MRWLKILVAIVILYLVLAHVGMSALVRALLEIDLFSILLLLLISAILITISALKWQQFLSVAGETVPLLTLIKLYTLGYFFNVFFPSYVGGDVARSYYLGKSLNSNTAAYSSTFFERWSGLVAMTALGLFFVMRGTNVAAGFEVAITLVALGVFFGTWVIFSKHALNIFLKLIKQIPLPQITAKLEKLILKVSGHVSEVKANPRLMFNTLLLSFLYHLIAVLNTYVAGRAVGWETQNISELFVVVPLALLIGMIPVTPGGIGVQEGAFVFLLERIGATKAQGLGLALVLRAKTILIAILGGLILMLVQKQHKKTAKELLSNA